MSPYAQKAAFMEGLMKSTIRSRKGAVKAPRLHPINTIALTVVRLFEGKRSGKLPNMIEVQHVTQNPMRAAPAATNIKLPATMMTRRPATPINQESGSRILPSFLDRKPKAMPATNPINVEIPIMVAPSAAVPIPDSII